MLIDVRSVQRALSVTEWRDNNGQALRIDGDRGSRSIAAARFVLVNLRETSPAATTYSTAWSDERVWIAAQQWVMSIAPSGPRIDLGVIDGLIGPRTQIAVERWQDFITFDRASPNPTAGVPAATVWPLQRDCAKFYGEPGKTRNVKLISPYPLYLDWELTRKVDGFLIHEKCHDSALRAMTCTLAHYGLDKIHELGIDQFGGCLNVRKMRNGSSWSMHAYACAIDFDADRNALRENHRTARFARPEYAAFLDCWEAEGWISLGRARDMDWMHLQAARL